MNSSFFRRVAKPSAEHEASEPVPEASAQTDSTAEGRQTSKNWKWSIGAATSRIFSKSQSKPPHKNLATFEKSLDELMVRKGLNNLEAEEQKEELQKKVKADKKKSKKTEVKVITQRSNFGQEVSSDNIEPTEHAKVTKANTNSSACDDDGMVEIKLNDNFTAVLNNENVSKNNDSSENDTVSVSIVKQALTALKEVEKTVQSAENSTQTSASKKSAYKNQPQKTETKLAAANSKHRLDIRSGIRSAGKKVTNMAQSFFHQASTTFLPVVNNSKSMFKWRSKTKTDTAEKGCQNQNFELEPIESQEHIPMETLQAASAGQELQQARSFIMELPAQNVKTEAYVTGVATTTGLLEKMRNSKPVTMDEIKAVTRPIAFKSKRGKAESEAAKLVAASSIGLAKSTQLPLAQRLSASCYQLRSQPQKAELNSKIGVKEEKPHMKVSTRPILRPYSIKRVKPNEVRADASEEAGATAMTASEEAGKTAETAATSDNNSGQIRFVKTDRMPKEQRLFKIQTDSNKKKFFASKKSKNKDSEV